jgi:hypothetical protein
MRQDLDQRGRGHLCHHGGTGASKQAHGFGLFTDDGKTLDLHVEYLAT